MRLLILALLTMIASLPARAESLVDETWHDAARNRDLPVRIRTPDGPGPFPTVLFSHGLGGSREHYTYFSQGLAAAGIAVVQIQHPGSDSGLLDGGIAALARAANLRNAELRAGDVAFVAGRLGGRLDRNRLGIAGHSFGAQTTLVASGQTLAGRDESVPAIRCGMAISAPAPRRDRALAGVDRPVLHVTGLKDDSPIGDTTPQDRIGVYRAIQAPGQALVVFDEADHMVFSGRTRLRGDAGADAAIRSATVALARSWFAACLNGRGLPDAAALRQNLGSAAARIEMKP